uniref:Serine protease n=1 Tax=Harzia tenella TaxID=509914 RepID=B8Q8C2_9PEZI|nr:serine protease [Harzia tenella]
MKTFGVGFLAVAVPAAAAPSFSIGTVHEKAAPILSASNAEVVADNYIIKFKDHVSAKGADNHHSWIQSLHASTEGQRMDLRRKRSHIPDESDSYDGVKHTYRIGESFMGYSGHFHEDVIEQVRNHPDIEYIERDIVVRTMDPVADEKCDSETEKNSPWGLARISHRDTLSFGTFNKYLYTQDGGEGVDAYVIDTGTNVEHVDFEGRAKWGKTIPQGDADIDGNGHGTHCSGTIAGKKYGVAKKANVYAVKVLRSNGSGTMSDVVKGVEWAANAHIEQVEAAQNGKRKGFKGSVANMSLGGGKTQALDAVVNAAVAAGVHFAVAAGNDNADACNYSPAAAAKAITVGASAIDDSRAYFSNWGKCTDIFAPGLSIQSTWIGSKYAVNTISGTSMASPHIAGLLAYYLSLHPAIGTEDYTPVTPAQLKADVLAIATENAISDLSKDTPNLLAWNGGGCSNYSSIIDHGSYKAGAGQKSPAGLVDLEKAVEDRFESVSKMINEKLDALVGKVETLVHELEH